MHFAPIFTYLVPNNCSLQIAGIESAMHMCNFPPVLVVNVTSRYVPARAINITNLVASTISVGSCTAGLCTPD